MKRIILVYCLFLMSRTLHSQTSFTVQAGAYGNTLSGGFENTSAIPDWNMSAGVSLDHTRGKVFGWMVGFNMFNKSFQFDYPTAGQTELNEGYVVRAHELQSAVLMRLGRHINLSIGPYLQINSRNIISGAIDSTIYFPSLPKDLYNSVEFGYQGKLQLQFYLGDRFYWGLYANAGTSLTDLRTQAWEEARALINGSQESWESDPLKNVYQHYGACIGLRSKQKQR